MHNWIDFKKSNFPFNLDFEVNSSKKNIIFAGILGPSQISGLKSFIESFDTLNSEEYDLILLIEGSEVPAFKNYINKKIYKTLEFFLSYPRKIMNLYYRKLILDLLLCQRM